MNLCMNQCYVVLFPYELIALPPGPPYLTPVAKGMHVSACDLPLDLVTDWPLDRAPFL